MVGQAAGQNVDGSSNTFIGQNAGQGSASTSTITNNTFVGCGVGQGITTGDYNTMIAGLPNSGVTTGSRNTLLGRVGLISTGNQNIGIGYFSFTNANGDSNILIGSSDATAAFNPSGATPDSEFWMGITKSATARVLMNGHMDAANQCKVGINNTSLPTATLHVKGQGATIATTSFLVEDSAGAQMMKITDSGNNISIGKNANKDASTDTYNVALGESALFTSAGGDHNFAAGYQAQYSLTTAQENIAIGNSALRTNATAGYNICMGRHAGYAVTGAGNTIIGGYNTGNAVAGGVYNTILGYQSGDTITSGGYNITIGYRADAAATVSNQIAIGDTTTVSGQYGIALGDTITAAGDRFVFGRASNTMTNDFTTDNSWTQSSDLRKKQNINDADLGLSFINKLSTKTYQWKPAEEHPEEWKAYDVDDEGNKEYHKMDTETVMHGLIAQEVKEALDSEGCDTFAGWKEYEDGQQGISKEMFVYPLIKAVQELSAKVAELEAKLENK